MASPPSARPAVVMGGQLSVALLLTALVVPLGVVASAAGLLAYEDLYGAPRLAAIIRGQDLVTLCALPIMAASALTARRGFARGLIVWAGLLGYLLYTYTGAALAYDFNRLFPAYLALFAGSGFALAALVLAVDDEALRARFDGGEPRRPVAVFLVLMAGALGIGEVAQMAAAVASGETPVIEGTDAPLNFVFALDLGVVVPLSLLGAAWLGRGAPWGHLLAGVMLVKAATMGLALLSMSWFAARAGVPGDGLLPLWVVIAAGGFTGIMWLLRHCRSDAPRA